MVELRSDVDARASSLQVAGPSGESARLVFEQILRHGPRSRSELAALLQLSGATLTRVTRDMLDSGLLRELPLVNRERGRPQEPLDVDEDHARFIGVKVTARETYAVATTVRGNPLEEISLPTGSARPEDVEQAVLSLVTPLLPAHTPVAGVGVSLGARVADDGVVLSSSMLGWETPVPLEARLTAALGVPVTVQNDLIALLQGVLWFGIGRRYESFVLVTIGAGIATGVVHRGQVVQGRTNLAGLTETLPTAGPDGRYTRLADIAGGPALIARARDCGAIGPDDELVDLLTAHRNAVPAALEIGEEVAQALAVSAGTLVGLLDPQAIIVGGEAIDLVEGHLECFDALLREQLSPMQRDIAVRRLPEDFDEWTRGAAVTAIQRFAAGR
ncbi:ROK family protein [Brachybacterium epidermidis]|uniref:ROK family protein n=1 Tax=Brachybacterium epidermidis TaxID=2781983 RepID=UPI00398E9128